MSEGALAYLIPNVSKNLPISLRDLARELDGLVLSGGSDVSPRSYRESAIRPEWEGDYVRDCYEIELVREFLDQEKPVLGICRGAQLINVAFGGTLYQDIKTQLPNALIHRHWEIYDQNVHTITFEKQSQLQRLYPDTKAAKVNSVHHQAIKDLGKDLLIEARSLEDGLIEAIRLNSPTYCMALQWHPEFHDPSDPTLLDGKPILREFLAQARC